MSKLSLTQQALNLVAQGVKPAVAAKEVGITETAVFRALARAKGKTHCPTCNQVVRAGFELKEVPPGVTDLVPPPPIFTITAAVAGNALRDLAKAKDAEAKRIILDLTRYI